MTDFSFFVPITKVDKERRTVSGYCTTPALDLDGEIVSLDAIKKAAPSYWEWRNIRRMHGSDAVGVGKELNIDDKGAFLTAKIVDEDAWTKCVEGVYKGFSIGGKKLAKQGNVITAIDWIETSIVDRPANPECKFDVSKKAKGAGAYLLRASAPAQSNANLTKALKSMAKVAETLALGVSPVLDALPNKDPNAKEPTPTEISGANTPAVEPKVKKKKKRAAASLVKNGLEIEHKPGKELKISEGPHDPKEIEAANAKKKAKKAKKLAAARVSDAEVLIPPHVAQVLAKMLHKDAAAKPKGDYGDVKYADPGYQSDGKPRYPIDTEDHIRAAWSYINKAKNAAKYSPANLAKVKSRIRKAMVRIGAEVSAKLALFDLEGATLKRKGIVTMPKNLHYDAGGDGLSAAIVDILAKAAQPTRAQRAAMAEANMRKLNKARKAAREDLKCAARVLKAVYAAKLAKRAEKGGASADDDGDDIEKAMGFISKAFGNVSKVGTYTKAAREQMSKLARSGQKDTEPSHGTTDYKVPPGVDDLSPDEMATAGGGGMPPAYPGSMGGPAAEAPYGGKKVAKRGVVTAEVAELMAKNAALEAEKNILMNARPSNTQRPHAFNTTQFMGNGGGNANNGDPLWKAVKLSGVDPRFLAVGDDVNPEDNPMIRKARAEVYGNYIMNSGAGRSVFDPEFRGGAAGRA